MASHMDQKDGSNEKLESTIASISLAFLVQILI